MIVSIESLPNNGTPSSSYSTLSKDTKSNGTVLDETKSTAVGCELAQTLSILILPCVIESIGVVTKSVVEVILPWILVVDQILVTVIDASGIAIIVAVLVPTVVAIGAIPIFDQLYGAALLVIPVSGSV